MIHFCCLDCGRKFQVKDEFAGRATRCPTCKAPLEVPQPYRTDATVSIGQLVVPDSGAVAGARAGALASITVAGDGSGSDQPVANLLAKSGPERGRYLIDKEIARGGMGAVLRGIDRDLRREIAVKVMLGVADPHKQARFVEEAQITGQLEHPNIVPVHELGLDEQRQPFFTMKMVKGRSLADILKRLKDDPQAERDWPLGRLLTILVNICHALSYAHSRRVIHRDLKPANIMVGDFGEVYVMDWGLAKVLAALPPPAPTPTPLIVPTPMSAQFLHAPPTPPQEPSSASGSSRVSTSRQESADLTQDGSIMGTPAYMAPEQALGRVQDIDQRSDIYALGGLLYALLTLQAPVELGGGQAALLMRVAMGEIKKPVERTPERDIAPELSAMAMKALAKEPKDRYQTVEALRRDVELFLTGHSVSAKHDTFREQAWKLVKRNRGASIATAAALVVLLVLAGFFLKINYTARVQAVTNYQAYQDAEQKRRASIPSFLTAARLLLEKRDFKGAETQVGLVLELEPNQAEGRLLRGQLAVIRQDFTAARPDLEAARRQWPKNALVKDLLNIVSRFKAGEQSTALVLAEVYTRHGAFALADGAVRTLGDNAPAAREQLLTLYKARIEKNWPGRVVNIGWAAEGGLSISVVRFPELVDLSPLRGLPLTTLYFNDCRRLRDLSPLRGMPLTHLHFFYVSVTDMTPLKEMPLTTLSFMNCPVSDLSPLKGMKLTTLALNNSPVADLSPLQGMPLTSLTCSSGSVKDLSPLKGMPLTLLHIRGTSVSDLSPLKGMPLTLLGFTPNKITRGLDVVRPGSMPSLKTIMPDDGIRYPAAAFWKLYDAGKFRK